MSISYEVYIGSHNPVKVHAVQNAFIENLKNDFLIEYFSRNVPSGVNSQPIGLEETKQGALNRMQNSLVIAQAANKVAFSVGIENGLIPGKELSEFFEKPFSHTNWYDVGMVAIKMFKEGSHFTYISCSEPLLIPNNEESGMLPPGHSIGLQSSLQKYQNVIMPLLAQKIDLYSLFSKESRSREVSLQLAASHALSRLLNVKVYKFDPLIKAHTVITVGTFDLFHSLHKRLIRNAFSIGDNLVVYVYNKDSKKKDLREVALNDTVESRIEHVTRYALEVCGKGRVQVRRMTQKHLPQLKRAIEEFSSQGSVTVYGGEDQFANFPEILDCCYRSLVSIVAINRGDETKGLCSSDIRERNSYKRIAASYNINHEAASVMLWKSKIDGVAKARIYLNKIAFMGAYGAEILKYDKSSPLDRKITKPTIDEHRMIICLPGRTKCNFDRARKIFRTIDEMMESYEKQIASYYLLSYQENEHNTEYYIDQLEKDPWGYFSEDAMMVMKNLILPKIASEIKITRISGKWIVTGKVKWMSMQQFKDSLTKVTLWARSRGSVIALEIENAFAHCLNELAFSKAEIISLAKQIVVLSISNLASFNRARLFSTVSVTGVNDKKARKCIPSFAKVFSKRYIKGTAFTSQQLTRTHLAVLAKIPESIKTPGPDRANLLDVITVSDPDRHYTPLYFSYRIGQDNSVPNLVRRGLRKMALRPSFFVLNQYIG